MVLHNCRVAEHASSLHDIPLPDKLLGAAAERQMKFRAGRHCAFQALKTLGAQPCFPDSSPQNTPTWPKGVVGSISHCREFSICAVAPEKLYSGLGIDVENVVSPEDASLMQPYIVQESETSLLGDHFAPDIMFSLLFSAKEAIYKAIYPRVQRFVDFHEMVLRRSGNTWLEFTPTPQIARLLGKDANISVSYQIKCDHVTTLCTVGPHLQNEPNIVNRH